jgi:hypothetical protein
MHEDSETSQEEGEFSTANVKPNKKISMSSIHESNLKSVDQLDAFCAFVHEMFKLPRVPSWDHLKKCYVKIYSQSFSDVFLDIFEGYQESDNLAFFEALSGLCMRKRGSSDNERYILVVHRLSNCQNQIGFLKAGRNFTCTDAQLKNVGDLRYRPMPTTFFDLFPFEKRHCILIGNIPEAVLARQQMQKEKKREQRKRSLARGGTAKRARKGGDFDPDAEFESESSEDEEGGVCNPKKRGKGRRSACAASSQGEAAGGVPAPSTAVRKEQAETCNLLGMFSNSVIVRSVDNVEALVAFGLDYLKEKKSKKRSDDVDPDLHRIDWQMLVAQRKAVRQMADQEAQGRSGRTKWLDISVTVGEKRFALDGLLSRIMDEKFADKIALEQPQEPRVDGFVSQRPLARHSKRGTGLALKVKENPTAPQPVRYIHMGILTSQAQENSLMVLTLNKDYTRYSFELAIPEVRQGIAEGFVVIFCVLAHPDAWRGLPEYLKKALRVTSRHTKDKNKSFFDFHNVIESPELDDKQMEDLCTKTLPELYDMCNRRAEQTLKQDGRSLHDIVEETLFPEVCAWTERSNAELCRMQAEYAEKMEAYEAQKRAFPGNPMNNPPEGPPRIETLDGRRTSEPMPLPKRVVPYFIPLPLLVACSPKFELAHTANCACNSAKHDNPFTGPIVDNYIKTASAKTGELWGMTLPKQLLGLCRCPPLCWFYQSRV